MKRLLRASCAGWVGWRYRAYPWEVPFNPDIKARQLVPGHLGLEPKLHLTQATHPRAPSQRSLCLSRCPGPVLGSLGNFELD